MERGFQDTSRQTGRRGFFRQLAISAIEAAEKVGKELSDRTLHGFRENATPKPTTRPQNRFAHADGRDIQYGPPWPPEFGPYIDATLRAQLRADQNSLRPTQGFTVPHDDPT